jgi:outer membrane protein
MSIIRFSTSVMAVAAALGIPLWVNAAESGNQWRLSVGGGVASIPEYPGSGRQRTLVVPVISATYGRFFIGGDPGSGSPGGAGFDVYRNGAWRLGVSAYGDLTRRRESDDARLRGLGDVDPAVRAGLFGVYSTERFVLRANFGSDISGHKQGTLVRLDALARFRPSERLTLSAGPGLTWANSQYTRTFFGVDDLQSARSGLPQFEARSGLNSVRFSVGASYPIDRSWSVGANFTAARLLGDARNSPVTVDKSQNLVGAFATYRF